MQDFIVILVKCTRSSSALFFHVDRSKFNWYWFDWQTVYGARNFEMLITKKLQFLSAIFLGMVSGSDLMLDFPVEMQEKLLSLFNGMEADFQQ